MGTLDRLSEIRIRIREGITGIASVANDARIAAVHRSLEQRWWGIAAELETIERGLDEMEQTLRSYAELKSGRLINFLAVFGFPLALFAGFFSFVFDEMPRDWSGLRDWLETDLDAGGPHWLALAVFGAMSVAGMVAIALTWRIVRWIASLLQGGRPQLDPGPFRKALSSRRPGAIACRTLRPTGNQRA